MMWQTMMELSAPFDCYVRKLGEGTALVMTCGSITANPQFLVRLANGTIRTVDQNDIIMYGNPTAGQDLIPEIPETWKQ